MAKKGQSAAYIEISQDGAEWLCCGKWISLTAQAITRAWQAQLSQAPKQVIVDASQIERLDSVGALVLVHIVHALSEQQIDVEVRGLTSKRKTLLHLVTKERLVSDDRLSVATKPSLPYTIGQTICHKLSHGLHFLSFFGELCLCLFHSLRSWRSFRMPGLAHEIEAVGFKAMPIIGLMSFLIGIVMGYQTGVQLQQYGGDFLIVNLIGVVVFREFGPLITAIIMAGRTSTAFTAQIGTMIVNEEVDALKTMGIVPVQRLVVPKLIGLIIAMPLLVVWADLFGVIGGFCVASTMLHMTAYGFFTRFQSVMSVSDFVVGMAKVPMFAIVIALVGCFQGFEVTGSAASVGQRTTISAVQALFMIIIVDAAYSVLITLMGV